MPVTRPVRHADRVTVEPSGGIFSVDGCEVYTFTRSRGTDGWMIVAEYLDGRMVVVPVLCDEPLRQPVVKAVQQCFWRDRHPFRAVLLRDHDEDLAVVKAQQYLLRVDDHLYGITPPVAVR